MGWTAPSRHRCARMVVVELPNMGAVHGSDYNRRHRPGKERIPGARCRRNRRGPRSAALRRNKNDRADAEAICEAVTRPRTRNVPIKSEAQQAALMMHRARDLLVRQRLQPDKAGRKFHVGFNVPRRDEADVMAEVAQLTRPVMRAGAGASRRPEPGLAWRCARRFMSKQEVVGYRDACWGNET
jgi:hypothetical protein